MSFINSVKLHDNTCTLEGFHKSKQLNVELKYNPRFKCVEGYGYSYDNQNYMEYLGYPCEQDMHSIENGSREIWKNLTNYLDKSPTSNKLIESEKDYTIEWKRVDENGVAELFICGLHNEYILILHGTVKWTYVYENGIKYISDGDILINEYGITENIKTAQETCCFRSIDPEHVITKNSSIHPDLFKECCKNILLNFSNSKQF